MEQSFKTDAKLTPEDVRIPVKDMAAGEEKYIYVSKAQEEKLPMKKKEKCLI